MYILFIFLFWVFYLFFYSVVMLFMMWVYYGSEKMENKFMFGNFFLISKVVVLFLKVSFDKWFVMMFFIFLLFLMVMSNFYNSKIYYINYVLGLHDLWKL